MEWKTKVILPPCFHETTGTYPQNEVQVIYHKSNESCYPQKTNASDMKATKLFSDLKAFSIELKRKMSKEFLFNYR